MSSLWTKNSDLPEFPSLDKNIKTDVLIIGGGIAGILCGYMLRKAGIGCVIAESDRICSGVTRDTTAKITVLHGLIYDKMIKRFGEKTARLYLKANTVAGAVKAGNQAQFNPLKFLSFVCRDLEIYENTRVMELTPDGVVCNGGRIKADKIIVATHFPFINKHGSYFLKMYQHRSYVIALENAPDLDGMYVDE